MINLKSPIPKHVNDPKWYTDFWQKKKLVPYAGTSKRQAHRLIDFLYQLYQNSPSKQICVNTKNRFAFEGDLDIISKGKGGLISDPASPSLTHTEKVQFCETFENYGLRLVDVKRLMSDFFQSKEIIGHAVIIIEQFSVAGIIKYRLSVPHGKHYAFIFPKKNDLWRSIVYSKDFSNISKNTREIDFEIIREYPSWAETPTGKKTFIIDRGNFDDSDFYGRPADVSTLRWQYVEGQKADQACRIADTDFIALYILAMRAGEPAKDGNEEDEWDANMKVLRELTTHEGGEKAKSITGMQVPFDAADMPSLLKLDVNRDSDYSKEILDRASSYIHAANGLPRELTNITQTKSTIGGNIYMDLFKVTDVNQIRPVQRWGEMIWDNILEIIGKEENIEIDKSFRFTSKLKEMIQLFSDDKDADQRMGNQEV